MKDTFGISRVIEPKGAIPVTAWKIDNRREINEREIRINTRLVHMEKSSFEQICYECGYDEDRIKAKIIDIVQKRGKLHNPFTDSGGMVYGKIEEIGKVFKENRPWYNVGDEVLCNTTITSVPLFIEKIESIDYNYGELIIKGYTILFENSPMFIKPEGLALNYTMTTLDEAGSIYTINTMVKLGMRVLIIGKDLVSTMVYIGSVKKALGENCYILTIMDNEACGSLTYKQVETVILKYADRFRIVDVTNPIEAVEEIMQEDSHLMDFTINCEDLSGSEVLSVLMTKEKGSLYFTNLRNGYSKAILIAESMGKEITTYSLDQYYEGYDNFTIQLLTEMRMDLDEINNMYESNKTAYTFGDKATAQRNLNKTNRIDDFVFASPVTKNLADQVINIANYDCNVIIQGETGVGKEKILELIHKNSNRKSNSCIKINCATIQENLAESEFFGYEAGAFTGAQAGGKKGYFELANNGILFLDEIGQLSPALQSKLLRVIQEGSFYRIGGTKQINVNVRVICANNIPIHKLVEEGKFREDLYYRLNICSIDVPPLRERREDIYCLAESFLAKYNKQYGIYKELTGDALKRLASYDWPGNVRELENKMHRIIINTSINRIDIADVDMIINENIYSDIAFDLKTSFRNSARINFAEIIESQEKKLLEYALKQEGSTRKAASYLNMTQAQLMRKKQKYGL
ncbi:sigma-54 interaction domain-containing protein [Aminipila sp.]|uniref:sigma-54 interaction domain-containing protein n=1 Tax=Aminipila sp. TaxID=2060095 RepID=UPI002897A093|nr:sigma 54-interacting transcriptional regulator [Aminipila sp.]